MISSKSPEQKAELEKLVASGSKSYGLKNYEEATDDFAKACELHISLNGEDDPDLLFLYGRSLFQVAVSSSDVLGAIKSNSAEQEKENTTMSKTKSSAADMSPTDKKGLFQFSGDNPDDDSDEEEEGGEQEEQTEDSDFETAWEVLDLARTLFDKQLSALSDDDENKETKRELKKKLADVYDILGEISLESENCEQAAADLESALNLKEIIYPFESTIISEAYYKLSLALEFVPDSPDSRKRASEFMLKAIESVKKRIQISGEDDPELLKDLEIRYNDLLKSPPKSEDKGPEISSSSIADILESRDANDLKSILAQAMSQANDISGLVKRKPAKSSSSNASSSKNGESSSSNSSHKRPNDDEDVDRKKTKLDE
ncbi:hypothetical protein V1511DRAFT_526577 [Dipodascopsis uninucleata]